MQLFFCEKNHNHLNKSHFSIHCYALTTETEFFLHIFFVVLGFVAINHFVQFKLNLLFTKANNATFHSTYTFQSFFRLLTVWAIYLIKRNWSLKPIKQFDWIARFGCVHELTVSIDSNWMNVTSVEWNVPILQYNICKPQPQMPFAFVVGWLQRDMHSG